MVKLSNNINTNNQEECILCKEPIQPKKKWTTGAVVVAGISGAVFVGAFAATVPFIAPAFRRVCLPYLPATPSQISNVMVALSGRKGTLLDIGSGDGRIVIEASRHGFRSEGVELNLWLVLYSRYSAWRQGQRRNTGFYKRDLWKADFSVYDNIVIFGVDTMMDQLESKFQQEITNNCRILASRFPLPNWQPIRIIGEGLDTVWVYMHPNNPEYKSSKLPNNPEFESSKLPNNPEFESSKLPRDSVSAGDMSSSSNHTDGR